jgi:5S rRNA maturation endonuclease (ribonuclease M5)
VSAVDRVLERLDGVKRSGEGWEAKCPAHDDRHASLSVAVGAEGRVLLKCHAGEGCSVEAIVAALGLTTTDLFEGERSNSRRIVATYDYLDELGALLFQAVRYEPKQFLQRRPDGRGGWLWKTAKTRRVLYRLPQVLEAVTAGRTVYVCEGEKDVHAVEAAGEVATCNPMGAGKWRPQFAKPLRGADVVIVQDRDDEGRKHADTIVASLEGVAKSVRRVEAAEGKDAADHLAAGHTVHDFVPLPDRPDDRTTGPEAAPVTGGNVREGKRTATGQPPERALEENILDLFSKDVVRAGVAGEKRLTQLVYLALTSRVLPWGKATERPVSVIPKGSTSTGKSHATQTTLRFFPDSAYIHLGSMSRRYLFYTEEEFSHRFVYVPEWASIADDEELVALLRTLLSEGRIMHGTVEGEGRRSARRIEKEGPTGLLMTTTEAAVDQEMETRCLSIVTDDSVNQTREVFKALAKLEDEVETPIDFDAWHELQEWIASHGETRAVIPFVHALAALVPVGATRLRRDFVTLLCLVRAHAILYQAQREKDPRGRVIATVEADYRPVAELVGELIAEAVEASVSATIRETVAAVAELQEEGADHVSVSALAKRLGIGRSATYARIRRALLRGYLVNETEKNERGMKLVVGAELPSAADFLPTPEEIVQHMSSEPAGQPFGSTMRPEGGSSGCPARPADLQEWLARDGAWRSLETDPPAFASEVVETR